MTAPDEHDGGSESRLSRRAVIGRLAAGALLGTAGCRRRSADETTGDVEPDAGPVGDAAPAIPRVEPVIRVRVQRVRDVDRSVRIGRDEQWIRMHRVDDPTADTVVTGPVQVRPAEGAWLILDGRGFRPAVHGFENVRFTALDEPDAPLQLGEVQYPGALEVVARSAEGAEAFDVVNHVPLEDYLPGVLAHELYSHWNLEAYAAVAVAARSFACSEHAYFTGRRHYDVTNTAASQMYVGAVDHHTSQKAARLTRGEILVFRNRLVPGYYSSCCGGVAAVATDAIGPNPINDIAPLRGRPSEDVCVDAPVYEWTVERSPADFRRRLRRYGVSRRIDTLEGLSGPSSIAVIETNPHGRPRRYRIIGDDGAATELSARGLRLGADFTGSGDRPPKRPLWSSNLEVAIRPDAVRLGGRGFGHGVGLCQYGAEQLALDGVPYQRILRWYYPGAAVEEGYR